MFLGQVGCAKPSSYVRGTPAGGMRLTSVRE
jgi:hypothetical protein